MSKRLPYYVPADEGPAIWRSLEEKADPERRTREAAEETSVVPEKSIVGRRRFMAVSGATAAAVGLSGCLRRPAENILPYSRAPEYSLPGIALHFATGVHHHGESIGLLVESHEGRPTKIEGNPEHPGSLGGTDALIQAMVSGLYDPDRSMHPMKKGASGRAEASWSDYESFWRQHRRRLGGGLGRGLAILAEPTDSPSFLRMRRAIQTRYPNARFHTWSSATSSNAREGARLAFGTPFATQIDFARARTVVAIDCDFLGNEPGAIRNSRRFADGRRIRSAEGTMNRLYVVEGTLSVTGMNADHRLRLKPSQVGAYLRALASRIQGVTVAPGARAPEGVPAKWITKVAAELSENRGASVVCVGSGQPPHVHALAQAINAALGNVGTVLRHYDAVDAEEPAHTESLRALTDGMRGGQVNTLLILGGNPVYDAPADLQFADALERVQTSIHLSSHDDETSQRCTWHLPRAHFLESWGDHRSLDGTLTVQQPLIAPLRWQRSDLEILAMAADFRGWRGYSVVRNTMREVVGRANFERMWRQSLHRGIVAEARPAMPRVAPIREGELTQALREQQAAAGEWEAVFVPSYQTHDGRYANVAMLLELPDPVTKIVWDNAAYISPDSATRLRVQNGDLLRISREGVEGSVSIPAFIVPGHADGVVTLPLGFGRTAVGRYGNNVGFDVHPLRTTDGLGFARVSVAKAGGTYELVQTQEHHSMEGRPLAIDATLEQYKARADFPMWATDARPGTPAPDVGPLWPQVDYRAPLPPAVGGLSYSLFPEGRQPREDAPARYKWGFVVDLTTCTGCSACVIACQTENNVAVVGKRQVQLGREMHWMRIDRYFVGDNADNPNVALQPIACQHCEEAPCENVCPVNATAHSPEGLNEMTYNRCIGTRYCLNNCPYKVRRFNFLDWHGDVPQVERMQFNPNVTVRMRGVMEKCTYCVQRIQAARIRARTETRVDADGEIHERRIRPEEVTPACAQACPSAAIHFGDLNETAPEGEEWRVSNWARVDRGYKLLASIGTQPRTTFLGKIRNPNPEMA